MQTQHQFGIKLWHKHIMWTESTIWVSYLHHVTRSLCAHFKKFTYRKKSLNFQTLCFRIFSSVKQIKIVLRSFRVIVADYFYTYFVKYLLIVDISVHQIPLWTNINSIKILDQINHAILSIKTSTFSLYKPIHCV